jgi:hypothetical protein
MLSGENGVLRFPPHVLLLPGTSIEEEYAMERVLWLATALALLITACGAPVTPQLVPQIVEVTRVVAQTVEVTRVNLQTVEVTREVKLVVTTTPRPATPTPKPTSTPEALEVGSRSNPVALVNRRPMYTTHDRLMYTTRSRLMCTIDDRPGVDHFRSVAAC